MKRKVFTKDGVSEIDYTDEEIDKLSQEGDHRAKKEILKKELKRTSNIQEEVNAIKKFLGVI